MAWPPILVRYGEIGIKSRSVRIQFEKRLVDRIEEQLVRREVEAQVDRQEGRIMVRAADTEKAVDALTHTFGVVSVSPAEPCDPTPEGVATATLEVARRRLREGEGFALRVKRVGDHAFTSLDVAKHAASRILLELADRKPHVDLDAPDVEVFAEVRHHEAFVFSRVERGPGGLPLGSQGRVGVLVDSPRAVHAAWLMGKRGSSLTFFSAEPDRAAAWLAPLAAWVPRLNLRAIEGATRGEQYAALAPELPQHKCQALVVADGIDEAILGREQDALVGVPVFRPLVGFAGARYQKLCVLAELPEV
ncbi:MAG TPA: THUMP domain-containing protein [Candidatus Thermoplasmatota archaeon]|nr:THUMP domain-containing protein [Candidatus Thermoplasmatota archaeon]